MRGLQAMIIARWGFNLYHTRCTVCTNRNSRLGLEMQTLCKTSHLQHLERAMLYRMYRRLHLPYARQRYLDREAKSPDLVHSKPSCELAGLYSNGTFFYH